MGPEESEATFEDVQGVDAARAIVWAAENINLPAKQATKKKAETDLARFGASHMAGLALNYYKYGKKPGIPQTKLLIDLMPKAMSIIDKHRAATEDIDVATAEKKSLKELEEFLEDVLEEAGLK